MCDIKAETINEVLQNTLKDKQAKMFIRDETGNILYEEGDIGISAQEVIEHKNSTGSIGYSKKNILETLFSKGYFITEVKSDITGWTYIYAEPFKNFNGFIKKVFVFNLIIIILASTVIIFFTKQLSSQILKPLKNIAFMIQKMKINRGEKNESFYMKGQNVNKLGIEIEQMIQRIDKLISDNYISDLKAKDAQIQVLVNQLSPHFLYNTLQLIEYQSYHNQKENITKIINGLSYILRYSISNVKTVCLKEELNYIRSYLDIYCLRYQNKLEYIITGEEDLENTVIPKMILEPVVENCIKHGFAGNFKNARIKVTIYQEDQKLFIAVRDNGKGINEKELLKLQENLEEISFLKEHIGLNNIQSIIRLRYGEPYGISIKSQPEEFTEITLQMPLNWEYDSGGI